MQTTYRPALIWGSLCFILLYRTLPAEVALSLQLFNSSDFPVMMLLTGILTNALPAVLPLACFYWLTSRKVSGKAAFMLLPLLAYFVGQLVVAMLIYFVTLKMGLIPFGSEGFFPTLLRWFDGPRLLSFLTLAVIIFACGYACWREMTLHNVRK